MKQIKIGKKKLTAYDNIRSFQKYWRPLDSRARTTTSTRFHLKFFHVFSNIRHRGNFTLHLFHQKKKAVIFIE